MPKRPPHRVLLNIPEEKSYYEAVDRLHAETGIIPQKHYSFKFSRFTREIGLLDQYHAQLKKLQRGEAIVLFPYDGQPGFTLEPVRIGKTYTVVKTKINPGNTATIYFYVPNSKVHGARILLADARLSGNVNNMLIPFNAGHVQINDAGRNKIIFEQIQGGFSSEIDIRDQKLISRGLTSLHGLWKKKMIAAIIQEALNSGKSVFFPTGHRYKDYLGHAQYNAQSHDRFFKEVMTELGLDFTLEKDYYLVQPKGAPERAKGILERIFG